MKFSPLALVVFATLTAASAAQACQIYTPAPERKYLGEMAFTGSSYVGIYAGASDSTPYAGRIKDGEVYIREKDSQKVATVDGSRMIDLLRKLVATVDGTVVSGPSGNVLAIANDPYNKETGLCAPEVALAGAALFVIYGQ